MEKFHSFFLKLVSMTSNSKVVKRCALNLIPRAKGDSWARKWEVRGESLRVG
jgi:hypothetical protein